MDFGTILRRSASMYATKPAVSCEGGGQTCAELFEQAARLVNAIAARGVAPGDRVALLGANGPRAVEPIAGIALGGVLRRVARAPHWTDRQSQVAGA